MAKFLFSAGETGLYISSLVNNVIFDDTETDGSVRKRLEGEAKTLGGHALWERLREVDPETAEKVHENNLPRVIRGLEVFETTGIPLSQHKVNSRREKSPYNACNYRSYSFRQTVISMTV